MMNIWPEIEWDDNGYPTEESIVAVKAIGWDFQTAHKFVRNELRKCAEVCCSSFSEEEAKDIMDKSVIHASFSTGGWSGAEDLIELINSRMDMSRFMLSWRRGGHYVFEFPLTSPE